MKVLGGIGLVAAASFVLVAIVVAAAGDATALFDALGPAGIVLWLLGVPIVLGAIGLFWGAVWCFAWMLDRLGLLWR